MTSYTCTDCNCPAERNGVHARLGHLVIEDAPAVLPADSDLDPALCTCGRPATVWLAPNGAAHTSPAPGATPWCGTNNLPPLPGSVQARQLAAQPAFYERSTSPGEWVRCVGCPEREVMLWEGALADDATFICPGCGELDLQDAGAVQHRPYPGQRGLLGVYAAVWK